jgi:hypothetical protein
VSGREIELAPSEARDALDAYVERVLVALGCRARASRAEAERSAPRLGDGRDRRGDQRDPLMPIRLARSGKLDIFVM